MKLELISVDHNSQKPPIVLHQFPVIVGLDPAPTFAWTIPRWAITSA